MTYTEYLNQTEIVKQAIGSVIVTDGEISMINLGNAIDVKLEYDGKSLYYNLDPETNILMALDNRTQKFTMASCFRYSPKVTIKGNNPDAMGITIVPKLANETELRITCGILGINPNKWQDLRNLF